ncbi:MAG: prephenate dehydrogenase/arogenate dehydrogenase family protein [Chloroflexi bacterium]|nr:prephenate dehydrogenase/arogenate dehydrogenase family protein [Chloroflexota bacterium]
MFAELLLPAVRACIIIDRFPDVEALEDGRRLTIQQTLQRLTGLVQRRRWQPQLFTVKAMGESLQIHSIIEPQGGPVVAVFTSEHGSMSSQEARPTLEALVRDLRVHPGVEAVLLFLPTALGPAVCPWTDVFLCATPYTSAQEFLELLRPYSQGLPPGSLYGDVLSIKAAPMRIACRLLPPHVGVIGLHPLFGRAAGDPTGLVVAVAPASDGRPTVPWQDWLVEQLAGAGLLLTPTSAEEHDAAMSFVQSLTHFVLLSYAFTFVRANQDPTQLLPFRTPVFEPLLYLAARVAALAQRTPDVYRAIQQETQRPELRRLFVDTVRDLLEAIERDVDAHEAESQQPGLGDQEVHHSSDWNDGHPRPSFAELLGELGAPWTPEYHQYAEPFEHLVVMSNTLTDRINALRYQLLRSNSLVKGIRNLRTGTVTVGAIYVDPRHHDRVDLASRVRFRRFNLTSGAIDEEREGPPSHLGSLPIAQAELVDDEELLQWLIVHTGPRSGKDDGRGAPAWDESAHRLRYIGRGHFDLSLAVPPWFDEDIVGRLLPRRWGGEMHLAWAALRHQDVPSPAVGEGTCPVIIPIVLIVPPQRVLDARREAQQQARATQSDPVRRRQREDQLLGEAITRMLSGTRDEVYEWLLQHGAVALHYR